MKTSKNLLIVGQEYNPHSLLRANFCEMVNEFENHFDCTVLVLRSTSCKKNVLSFSGSYKVVTIINFIKLILKYSTPNRSYNVFIHQGGLYPILLFPFKIIYKFKIFQWKAHPVRDVSWWFYFLGITDVVFTVSKSSYPKSFRKPALIGHGVYFPKINHETDFFVPITNNIQFIYAGRIADSKKVLEMVDFVVLISKQLNLNITFDIVGFNKINKTIYEKNVINKIERIVNKNLIIRYMDAQPRDVLMVMYTNSNFVLNFSNTALDKSVIEACAFGCVPLSTNINISEEYQSINYYSCYYSYNDLHKLLDTVDLFVTHPNFYYEAVNKIKSEARAKSSLASWVTKIIRYIR